MVHKKRSLMFKLMTAVNVTALMVMAAMVFFILVKTSREVETQIDSEVTQLVGSIQFTLADYVKEKNVKTLQILADDMIDDETINEVYIFDKDKKLLVSAKNTNKDVLEQTETLFENKADILKLGEKEKGPLGSVVIKYNHNDLKKIKRNFFTIAGSSIVISQFILAFVMWIILSKSLKTITSTTDKLRELSRSTSESSKEVEGISEEVSSSANEQAASIQETVATLDQITSQVTTTVESVNNSTKKSEESLGIANEGKVVVGEMLQSMEAIGKSNQDIMDEIARGNERIGGIVKIINEISQKTAVINDIVFQTKLLSFNASVEAARAGEHGKGFAVVAEEVGKLAQMSGTASTQISAILGDSIIKVNSVIDETNKNVKVLTEVGGQKVDAGMKVAERCGLVLEDIVTNAAQVKNMMSEISVASKEQAEGVRNIAAAMNQLDQATLSNNRAAAMSSENAKLLSQHSSSLQFAVSELQKEIFGGEQRINTPAQMKTQVKKETVAKEMPKAVVKKMDALEAKKTEVKHESKKDNVLPLVTKTTKSSPPQAEVTTKPKAVNGTPIYNDPRFEDV